MRLADLLGAAAQQRMNPGARMTLALNTTGKHIYGGTVPGHVKARRRAANKVARASRRRNR